MLFTESPTKFKSEMEVRVAFVCGKLPWGKGDTPAMLELRSDAEGRRVIENHKFVRVLDVCGLSASHDPVYLCETEGRDLVQAESPILVHWQRLLLDEKGQPSDYAKWQHGRTQARRSREIAGHRTQIILVASFPR